MTELEKLKLAAKACGYEVIPCEQAEDGGIYVCTPGAPMHTNGFNRKDERHFAPHVDQADSDTMAIKLRIDTYLSGSDGYTRYVSALTYSRVGRGVDFLIERCENHDGTHEDVCRAVRKVRLLVAAEIGGENEKSHIT